MDLQLNFEDIRKRIEIEKEAHKQGSWAKFVGVPSNIVSNIHGKIQQNPSFPYIISVALATGKSVDYYLWGEDTEKIITQQPPDNIAKIIVEHQGIVKRFKNPKKAKEFNQDLLILEEVDQDGFEEVHEIVKRKIERKGSKKKSSQQTESFTKKRSNGA